MKQLTKRLSLQNSFKELTLDMSPVPMTAWITVAPSDNDYSDL